MRRIVDTIKPFVPSSIKRPLKRLLYPDWYKDLVGGDWEEIGEWQIDFWREHGLKPEHDFLDVGCGA
jgi:hypothetical protein